MDAGQMTAVLSAVLLRVFPRVSAGEVPVAVACETSSSCARNPQYLPWERKRAWGTEKSLRL